MSRSRAFIGVHQDLLIAKLNAYYRRNPDPLQLKRSNLFKIHQRVKVNSTFSDGQEIKSGVPQGSVLGRLLLNVFINNIFLFAGCTNI